MQLVLLLLHDEVHPPPHGLRAPGSPLLQQLPHAQHFGGAGDQDIEVAGEGILQRGELEELGHELVRVRAPFEVNGQLQSGEVRLIPHVGDLLGASGLDELRHLVQNGLHRGRVGDLIDLNEVLAFQIAVFGPHPDAAPARLIDLTQGCRIRQQLSPGGEVRRQQRLRQVTLGIFQIGHGGIADLFEIEAAELGGHAHGDAAVGAHQNIGEGSGQQGRLLHGIVVVVHEVHSIGVDIPEELRADGGELGLRITGGGAGHVPGVAFAEVALGVHKGGQQGAVALGKAHHGIVDGGIAVGVQSHGLAHDVGGLGPSPRQKPHLVHGVEELSVGGFEAVDLRDGPGNDDAHGVGHIVEFQRVGDGLLHHRRMEPHDVGIIYFWPVFLRLLLFWHGL